MWRHRLSHTSSRRIHEAERESDKRDYIGSSDGRFIRIITPNNPQEDATIQPLVEPFFSSFENVLFGRDARLLVGADPLRFVHQQRPLGVEQYAGVVETSLARRRLCLHEPGYHFGHFGRRHLLSRKPRLDALDHREHLKTTHKKRSLVLFHVHARPWGYSEVRTNPLLRFILCLLVFI